MKKLVKITNPRGEITYVFDLSKISEIYRLSDSAIKVVIDSVSETWRYDNKQECDKHFDLIVSGLIEMSIEL